MFNLDIFFFNPVKHSGIIRHLSAVICACPPLELEE